MGSFGKGQGETGGLKGKTKLGPVNKHWAPFPEATSLVLYLLPEPRTALKEGLNESAAPGGGHRGWWACRDWTEEAGFGGQFLPRAVFLFYLSLGCISPRSRLQLRGQLPVNFLGGKYGFEGKKFESRLGLLRSFLQIM